LRLGLPLLEEISAHRDEDCRLNLTIHILYGEKSPA